MRRIALIGWLLVCTASAVHAQLPPGLPAQAPPVGPDPYLQNRIPAPLPPPPQPPVINGPLSQSPPQRTYTPPRLRTYGDRSRDCLHEGAALGLHGAKLDRYTRTCANAN